MNVVVRPEFKVRSTWKSRRYWSALPICFLRLLKGNGADTGCYEESGLANEMAEIPQVA